MKNTKAERIAMLECDLKWWYAMTDKSPNRYRLPVGRLIKFHVKTDNHWKGLARGKHK